MTSPALALANEVGDWDNAVCLLPEAEVALISAKTADTETQISLMEAERALT